MDGIEMGARPLPAALVLAAGIWMRRRGTFTFPELEDWARGRMPHDDAKALAYRLSGEQRGARRIAHRGTAWLWLPEARGIAQDGP